MLELFFFVVIFADSTNPVSLGMFQSHGDCVTMRGEAHIEYSKVLRNEQYRITPCLSFTFTLTGRPSDMKPNSN